MKTDFLNSVVSVFSIMLIILGVVPDLAFALDGQLGDSLDLTNSTPHSNLVIEKFYTDPEVPKPNSDVTIYALVKNEGDASSNPVYLKLTIDGVSSDEYSESIAPGSEANFSHKWTTSDKESTVILTASIEGVENSQKTISVVVENPRPDLIIQNIVPEPANPQEGELLNFTVNVKNQGEVPSGDAMAMYYVNGVPGQNIGIPPLLAGASTDLAFSLAPDQVKGGPMEVKAVVDSGNTVLESNETNNEFTIPLTVKSLPSDLTIESISLSPPAPKVGDNIIFTATIKNNGPGASPASKLKYNINGTNETNNDTLSVPALTPGEATQITFSWTPRNEGNIEVTALVDTNSDVSDINEMNNQLTINAPVTKDSVSTDGGGGGSSSSGSGKSSSGSGSGMGSSFSKEPAKNVASKELATRYVMSDSHIKYDFLHNSTCIMYIEYDAVRTFLKTTTTVEELKGKSTFVPALPFGKTYKFINIWVGGKVEGLPSSLKNGSIGFKIEKSWIKNNSVNESLITLQRYDKNWEPLYTEKVGEDNNYAYFKSKTPGFFFFAITYTGEGSENGVQIGAKLPNTPGSLGNAGNASNKNESKSKAQQVREVAKILMALLLPIFLILIGYLVVKKKI